MTINVSEKIIFSEFITISCQFTTSLRQFLESKPWTLSKMLDTKLGLFIDPEAQNFFCKMLKLEVLLKGIFIYVIMSIYSHFDWNSEEVLCQREVILIPLVVDFSFHNNPLLHQGPKYKPFSSFKRFVAINSNCCAHQPREFFHFLLYGTQNRTFNFLKDEDDLVQS